MELNHPDDPRNTRAYLEAAYRYLIEDNLRLSDALSDYQAEVKHLRAILNTLQRAQCVSGGDALSRGHRAATSTTSRGNTGPEPRQRAPISATSRPSP